MKIACCRPLTLSGQPMRFQNINFVQRTKFEYYSEIKVSQYANDTTLIPVNGTQESLSAALDTINSFGSVSGLKLNDKKTEALWIGSLIGNKERLLPEMNFKWSEKK